MLLSRTKARFSKLSITRKPYQKACSLIHATWLYPLAEQLEESSDSLSTNVSSRRHTQDNSDESLIEIDQSSLDADPEIIKAPRAVQPNVIGPPSLKRRKGHMFAVMVEAIDIREQRSTTSVHQICPNLASANETVRDFAGQRFHDKKLFDWGFYQETLGVDGSVQCIFSDEGNGYRYVVKVSERWVNSNRDVSKYHGRPSSID